MPTVTHHQITIPGYESPEKDGKAEHYVVKPKKRTISKLKAENLQNAKGQGSYELTMFDKSWEKLPEKKPERKPAKPNKK